MVQVELGSELEERLISAAEASGVTVDEFVRKSVRHQLLESSSEDKDRAEKRSQAIEELRTFAHRHKLTLGPDTSFKDLVNEGRR